MSDIDAHYQMTMKSTLQIEGPSLLGLLVHDIRASKNALVWDIKSLPFNSQLTREPSLVVYSSELHTMKKENVSLSGILAGTHPFG